MRIEKFEKKRLISGPARAIARMGVLTLLVPLESLERLWGHRRRYAIILGHMRAGSSLLTNVIVNSDEASGYGETFTCYSSSFAFRLLLARVRLQRLMHGKLTVPGALVIDKALHNKLTPNPEPLDHPDVRFVFLIRDGERAVRSMVHEFDVEEQTAADYYTQRIEHLVSLARFLSSRKLPILFLTFEELTSQRDSTLDRLRRFLGLEHPLSASFRAAPGAARPGAGDPSGRLGAGEILQTQRELTCDISNDMKVRLEAVYERAIRELGAAAVSDS